MSKLPLSGLPSLVRQPALCLLFVISSKLERLLISRLIAVGFIGNERRLLNISMLLRCDANLVALFSPNARCEFVIRHRERLHAFCYAFRLESLNSFKFTHFNELARVRHVQTNSNCAMPISPDAPTSIAVKVVTLDHHSLTLSWEDDDENPVSGYIVNFKSNLDNWEEQKLVGKRTSYVLENLRCGTKYQLTVTPYNRAGRAEPSIATTAATAGNGNKPRRVQFAFVTADSKSDLTSLSISNSLSLFLPSRLVKLHRTSSSLCGAIICTTNPLDNGAQCLRRPHLMGSSRATPHSPLLI